MPLRTSGGEVKDQSKGDLSYPQGLFLSGPAPAGRSTLAAQQPAEGVRTRTLLQLPRNGPSASSPCPIHHRVPENLMKCTDCHNPHGTMNAAGPRLASLNAPNFETCVKCHVEKRGPYCVRASGGKSGRLHLLPQPSRQHQPHACWCGARAGSFACNAIPDSTGRPACLTAAWASRPAASARAAMWPSTVRIWIRTLLR